jgi:hypothetical protein
MISSPFRGLFFLCLIISAFFPVSARANDCERLRTAATDVQVELFMLDTQLQDAVPAPGEEGFGPQSVFTRWAAERDMKAVWQGSDTRLGTFSALAWDLQADFEMEAIPVDQFKSSYCPYILAVTVDVLALPYIDVQKASRGSTCKAIALAEHEDKHAQTSRYVVEQAVQNLRRALPRIARDLEMEGMIPGAEVDDGMQRIREDLSEAVNAYLAEEVGQRLRTLHAEIDIPDEYARLSKMLQVCDIKDAIARGDKAAAVEFMRKYKGESVTPPKNP